MPLFGGGRDLYIQSLQNTSLSENSNWGFSVTFCGAQPCAGSVGVGGGESSRAWADDVSGLFVEDNLDILVGDTTSLLGGVLAAGLNDDYDANTVALPQSLAQAGWTTESGQEGLGLANIGL